MNRALSPRSARRLAVGLLTGACVLAAAGGAVAGDEGTPSSESPLARMGYPELRITVTEDGVEAPAEVGSGRYLVTVEAAGRGNTDVHLVQLPPGTTEAEAEAALAAAADEDVPSVVHEWDFAAGLFVPLGDTDHLVVDLTPGDWFIVGADGPSGSADDAAPVTTDALRPLAVTAGGGADAADPVADATVALSEFGFAGLPDGSPAGRQVWKVTNTGDQVHHVILAYYPGEITVDQVRTLVALGDEGTPPPGFGVDPDRIEFEVGQVHVLSPGRTVWVELDLARAGGYIAVCFMPDRETGADHASLGEVGVFAVR